MSQINKKYLDILKQIDEEHKSFGDLHKNSKTLVIDGLNTFIRSWSTAPNLSDNGDHIGGIVGTLKSIGYAIRLINLPELFLHLMVRVVQKADKTFTQDIRRIEPKTKSVLIVLSLSI